MKFWYLLRLEGFSAVDILVEPVTPHFVIYESLGCEPEDEELWTVTHSLTGYAAIYAPSRLAAIDAAEAMEAIAKDPDTHEVWGFLDVAFMPHGLPEKAKAVISELKASWDRVGGGVS